MAQKQCRNNRCIGTQSGLRFTDTRSVYVPGWHLRVLADGYESTDWIDVNERYCGKTIYEGLSQDRLTIRVTLNW